MENTTLARSIRGIGYSIRSTDPNFADLPAKLDEAEALGVDFVELPLFCWTLIANGQVMREPLERLVRATRGRPFGYTAHGPLAINLMETPARIGAHAALLDAAIGVAQAVEAEHLVIHTGCVRDPDETFAVGYARQREALQRAGDRAGRAGVTLCVENIFRFAPMRETASPSRLASEIDAIAHPSVRATLDVSHAYLRCADGKLDPVAEIAALAPYARHIHAHDSFGLPSVSWAMDEAERLGLGEGDLHLPIGWGSLPWKTLAASLTPEAGAILNLELHGRYWSELPAQIDMLRALTGRAPLPRAA
ncbi:sugar phosphate isomerase/epimerase family protein [Aquabacter cavernae]|uniref:sugar phosphate isomerase/epimerase family protein n=1 Tax=Aquabacter cavernae TaxID=2496029 RepID=UPI000F8E1EB2|nr:sugar phosphate isomerase/epimerase family protein [Aquabacter cavernae]